MAVSDVFGTYDKGKSIENCKNYLKQYHDWKLKAAQSKPTIGSPSLSGLPKGTLLDPDHDLVEYVNAEREWKVRENAINWLQSIGDEYEIYAMILDCRFVHHDWTVAKTIQHVHDKTGVYLPERTFNDWQKRALWVAAKEIGKPVLVKRKN